jgi:hypothetical protein
MKPAVQSLKLPHKPLQRVLIFSQQHVDPLHLMRKLRPHTRAGMEQPSQSRSTWSAVNRKNAEEPFSS